MMHNGSQSQASDCFSAQLRQQCTGNQAVFQFALTRLAPQIIYIDGDWGRSAATTLTQYSVTCLDTRTPQTMLRSGHVVLQPLIAITYNVIAIMFRHVDSILDRSRRLIITRGYHN